MNEGYQDSQSDLIEDYKLVLNEWMHTEWIQGALGADGITKLVVVGDKLKTEPSDDKLLRLIAFRQKKDPRKAAKNLLDTILVKGGMPTGVSLYLVDEGLNQVFHVETDRYGVEVRSIGSIPISHVFFGDPDIHGRMLQFTSEEERLLLGGLF